MLQSQSQGRASTDLKEGGGEMESQSQVALPSFLSLLALLPYPTSLPSFGATLINWSGCFHTPISF